jgi:hypothetical protein
MIERPGTTIFARDLDGEEHRLRVIEHQPGPLISIGDDDMTRILAPGAARELCGQLARIMMRHPPWRGSGRTLTSPERERSKVA